MNEEEKFGSLLKKLRLKNNYSLRQLAQKIIKDDGKPLSPSYLNDIERGRRNPPSAYIVEQLAKLLGEDVDFLLHEAGKTATEVERIIKEEPKIGALLRRAKKIGFDDWDAVEQLVKRKKGNEKDTG
jgi:transcriptional regulator with XRE-family HTH domain